MFPHRTILFLSLVFFLRGSVLLSFLLHVVPPSFSAFFLSLSARIRTQPLRKWHRQLNLLSRLPLIKWVWTSSENPTGNHWPLSWTRRLACTIWKVYWNYGWNLVTSKAAVWSFVIKYWKVNTRWSTTVSRRVSTINRFQVCSDLSPYDGS